MIETYPQTAVFVLKDPIFEEISARIHAGPNRMNSDALKLSRYFLQPLRYLKYYIVEI